jgi:alpha-beta hydrolase superfamily lysophospholipase
MSLRFLKSAARKILFVLATGVVVLAIAWWVAHPGYPDGFYMAPAQIPTKRGALLRIEAFTREVPAGARGWRILYTTTRVDNSPAIASAIVVAPEQRRSGAYPVIAWAHGGTGIVPGCAPSVMAHPFGDAGSGGAWALLPKLLAENWVFVGTDYIGLGTAGGHAGLIGDEAARAGFDAVRSAHRIGEIELDDRVVVWGHSQGGHTALWSGIRAQEYAPDLKVLGIAAIAPTSDLRALFAAAYTPTSTFAKLVLPIMSSLLIRSYSAAYEDVDEGFYIQKYARILANDMTGRCLGEWRTAFSVLESALLPAHGIFAHSPGDGPLGRRLEQNTPTGPIPVPVMITQGDQDDLVLPDIQRRFVAARCAAGQRIDFRTYPGRNHESVTASDSPLVPDLIDWTRDRLAGLQASTNCAP